MSAFQELLTVPIAGAQGCIKILCKKMIPEKLISFHRTIFQRVTPKDYRVILLEGCDLEDLFIQLSITFLGQTSIYALKDGDISVPDRKKLDNFLKEYSGPHTLYFFTSDPVYEKNALVVESIITKKLFQELAFSGGYTAIAPTFIEKLFMLKSSYTFDESLSLLQYAHLLGVRNEAFFSDWVARIVSDDISLFTLSQYFFAQQKNLLLKEWSTLKKRYPVEFWIAFFSEQLWQAILYYQYASLGKAAEAKRFAYRLPFSYFQNDWKRYSFDQLVQAHAFLYEVDHGLKNGYATEGIEIFIHASLRVL